MTMPRPVVPIEWIVAVTLTLGACHDARRDNPLDPPLTAPVDLQVAFDPTAGTASLTWSPYVGVQPFAEYLILRNASGATRVDTLARLTAADTAFVDTTLAPDTGYEYRVAVVNTGGFESPSQVQAVPGFSVGAAQLIEVADVSADGALAVRWHRYAGPDFVAYRVRRSEYGSALTDTLLTTPDVLDTVFQDPSAVTGKDYIYTVDTQAAGRVLVSNSVGRRLTLPPVELAPVEASSRTATATLQWSAYTGPRFRAYRVLRRAPDLVAKVIATFDDPAVTSLADTALLADTEYTYRVVVDTDRGEQIESQERSTTLHPLVGSWPLDAPPGAYVRLYAEEEGRLTVLVSEENRVRLLICDREGRLLEEQVLLSHDIKTAFASPANVRIHPQSVATALTPDGERLLSLVNGDQTDLVAVLAYDSEGRPEPRERELFRDASAAVDDAGPAADGRVELVGVAPPASRVQYDDLSVYAGADLLYRLDPGAGRLAGWLNLSGRYTDFGGGQVGVYLLDGRLSVEHTSGSGEASGTFRSYAEKRDSSFRRFRVVADLSLHDQGNAGIRVTDGYSTLRLLCNSFDQHFELFWRFEYPPSTGLTARQGFSEQPFPLVPRLTYRLGLGLLDGAMTATVASSVLWFDKRDPGSRLGCMALLDRTVALTSGQTGYTISEDGLGIRATTPFSSPVSELRVWQLDGRPWIGACLTQDNAVAFARASVSRITGQVAFPNVFGVRILGAGAGQAPGEFLAPVSFDAGPDGRLFVLDAGNSRIQVFDGEGRYITRWGSLGSGPGQFDFSDRDSPEQFTGSVAVDDEGYIYVADVVNARIQRFAP